MHSHSRTSSMDQEVIPPMAALTVKSHREQGQAELSTHYHSFKWRWNSLGFIPTLNTRQIIKSCSSVTTASNRAAIFPHTADIMKPMLPHLLHTQYMLLTHTDTLLCLQLHTVGSQSVFTLSRFSHLTHSGIRLMQMEDAECSSYMLQNILYATEHLTTCHLHFRMR
jgi:hypothetical protein